MMQRDHVVLVADQDAVEAPRCARGFERAAQRPVAGNDQPKRHRRMAASDAVERVNQQIRNASGPPDARSLRFTMSDAVNRRASRTAPLPRRIAQEPRFVDPVENPSHVLRPGAGSNQFPPELLRYGDQRREPADDPLVGA
jgi:hypothetical protein